MDGFIAPGFEEVGYAFEDNFRRHGEIGAAFAAAHDGKPVVDVWGGLADQSTTKPWTRDSLVLIFSGTKGLVATCILTLIDRHQIDLDQPVSHYWPEFGKRQIRVRDVVSHTSRLPGIDGAVTLEDLVDDRRMSGLLARQEPSGDSRAIACYHPLTYGLLCGELVRQIDGRSIGRFFADEIAAPLGLDIWIGLPPSEEHRVSTLELSRTWGVGSYLDACVQEHDAFVRSIWGNPEILSPRSFPWNRTDFHRAEIPGGNAIGNARSIAKLYSCLACGGAPILSERTVELGRQAISTRREPISGECLSFGVGFQLQTETSIYGPPLDAFGHTGAGGSVHGAWPTERVGFSYAMNFMRDDEKPDPRASELLSALHTAIRRSSG